MTDFMLTGTDVFKRMREVAVAVVETASLQFTPSVQVSRLNGNASISRTLDWGLHRFSGI